MHHDMVRLLLRERPFVPLLVRMASGVEHRIVSPESDVSRRTAVLSVAAGHTTVAVELIEEIRRADAPERRAERSGEGGTS